jgi:hypothetical protein
MNNKLPDERTVSHDALFAALRAKLKSEVSGSAMLTDLLQKVNGMQEVYTCPAEFKGKFDEFVGRAQEYSTAIRPFYPDLVGFLPDRRTVPASR